MQSKAETVEQYLDELPEDKKLVISTLRKTILDNLPEGFVEEMNYGMIGYVVPHSIYPAGYHCTPKLPLPFINLVSQKNFIALHMMSMADESLANWFTNEYPKYSKAKLDMGKSCIRFKKLDQIPYELIGESVAKMSVNDWIDFYEKTYKNKVK